MSFSDLALQLLAGWLIADLLSGVVHWLEDRVLCVGLPVLGRHVVAPNRLHHLDPAAFLRQSVWSRNSTTWLTTLAIAAAWLWTAGFSFIWLAALVGGLVVTEVHVRAHRPTGSEMWATLQEIGVLQSRRQHWQHHRGAMDRRYCVLTGWLNPILDVLRVWERLEAALTTIGLQPNRGTK